MDCPGPRVPTSRLMPFCSVRCDSCGIVTGDRKNSAFKNCSLMLKPSNSELDLNWNICVQKYCGDEIHVAVYTVWLCNC